MHFAQGTRETPSNIIKLDDYRQPAAVRPPSLLEQAIALTRAPTDSLLPFRNFLASHSIEIPGTHSDKAGAAETELCSCEVRQALAMEGWTENYKVSVRGLSMSPQVLASIEIARISLSPLRNLVLSESELDRLPKSDHFQGFFAVKLPTQMLLTLPNTIFLSHRVILTSLEGTDHLSLQIEMLSGAVPFWEKIASLLSLSRWHDAFRALLRDTRGHLRTIREGYHGKLHASFHTPFPGRFARMGEISLSHNRAHRTCTLQNTGSQPFYLLFAQRKAEAA